MGKAILTSLVALAAPSGFGGLSHGQDARTVGELAGYCEAERGSVESALCGGLVEGMVQMLIWNCVTREYGWRPDPTVVAGPPPSLEAAVEAFVEWTESNPREAAEEWHLGLASALTEAFPCDR